MTRERCATCCWPWVMHLREAGELRHVLKWKLRQHLLWPKPWRQERRASRACYLRWFGITYYAGAMDTPEAATWVELADRYARPETTKRVWADMRLGVVKTAASNYAEGVPLLTAGLNLARRLGDPKHSGGLLVVYVASGNAPHMPRNGCDWPRNWLDVTKRIQSRALVASAFSELPSSNAGSAARRRRLARASEIASELDRGN